MKKREIITKKYRVSSNTLYVAKDMCDDVGFIYDKKPDIDDYGLYVSLGEVCRYLPDNILKLLLPFPIFSGECVTIEMTAKYTVEDHLGNVKDIRNR